MKEPDKTKQRRLFEEKDAEQGSVRRSPTPRGEAKFKDFEKTRHERELFAHNVFELLPQEHDCFLFVDLFEQLDTRGAHKKYSSLGQRAYDPKQLLSILVYAYSQGVFSSRQIERRCNEDLSFMYVSGKNCPNFRVLSDFRKDHLELLHDCFTQTVKLAMELKLASLGHVSLDGSKFKASSSKHKAMSYQNLKAQDEALSDQIEALLAQAERNDSEEDRHYQERTGYELPEDLIFLKSRQQKIRSAKAALEEREKSRHPGKEIDGKKQISFADHDANIMGKPGTGYGYAYNVQISVDGENQIIVGQHISQQSNDYNEVAGALTQLTSQCGVLPEKMSMDNGYYSGENLATLEAHQVEAYVAPNREDKKTEPVKESERQLVKSDFVYDKENDCFYCPQEQVLEFKREASSRRFYEAQESACGSCSLKARCTRSKARTITTDGREAERERMVERMGQAESKTIYEKRKVIVEPVFGQIKNTGFRGFSVRGKSRVEGEFSLVSAAHNLKKIVAAYTRGLLREVDGKWVSMAA